ncbi:MAG: TonB-dependent receptor [Treponema sp.]|nr:TonB-dependent receptor [Treponema sp.]
MFHFNFSLKGAGHALLPACLLVIAGVSVFAQNSSTTIVGVRDKTKTTDIAASVDIISEEDIVKSGKSTVTELLESVPGVSLSGMTGSSRRGVSIGGYGENAYGRVLILLDGVPLNNPDMVSADLSWIQVSSIKQIEVYKGDASALYGNQAVAGVISITTKEAAKRSVMVEGSASTNKTVTGTASASTAGDSYGVTVSATMDNERHERENAESYTGTVSVGGFYDVTDTVSIHTQVSAHNDRYGMPGSASERDATTVKNPYDYAKLFGTFVLVKPEWDFSEQGKTTLPLSYTYSKVDSAWLSSKDWSDATKNYFSEKRVHTITFRPDVSYQFNDAVKAYAAFDSQWNYVSTKTGYDTSFTALEDASLTPVKMSTSNYAPVANITFTPVQPLQLELTGRYDSYTIRYDSGAVDASKSYSKPVWKASVLYHVTESDEFDSSVYASYGSIFRYPFTDEVGSFYGYTTDKFSDLKAETGYSARLGYKGVLNIGSFDVYGGWSSTDNEIVYNGATYANENMDPITRWTAGASVKVTPIQYVAFTAGYTFVNAKFTSGTYKDKKVPLVSEHVCTAGITIMPIEKIAFGSTIRIDSPYYLATDFANAQDKEPVAVNLGLNASCKVTEDFTLYANADNLLEKAKPEYAGYSSSAGAYYYPRDGRTFTVKARIMY